MTVLGSIISPAFLLHLGILCVSYFLSLSSTPTVLPVDPSEKKNQSSITSVGSGIMTAHIQATICLMDAVARQKTMPASHYLTT